MWQVNGRPLIDTGEYRFRADQPVQGATRGGQLKVTTTNLKPGYLRKNGVPYSEKAVLTECSRFSRVSKTIPTSR